MLTHKNIASVLYFASFLIGVYFLNCFYHFSSDDCLYGLCTEVTNASPVRLGTIANAWIENFHDGHRPIVHFLVRIFTGVLGKTYFNIANTLMWGALIVLIVKMARGSWSDSFSASVEAIALVFLILCKGESYLWCAGSINYLWTGVGTLAFITMLKSCDANVSFKKWNVLVPLAMVCVILGWMQEAFALPVCFAMGIYTILNWKRTSREKWILMVAYGVGAIFLAYEAVTWIGSDCRGSATISGFTLQKLLINLLKIGVTIKAVWLVLVLFAVCHSKFEFIKRNQFELLCVLGSICMITLVGFNGERSLWIANLMSIVILVREFQGGIIFSRVIMIIMLSILSIVLMYGKRISDEFNSFVGSYMKSNDGIVVHQYVDCGLFNRFFHQAIYHWQPSAHHACFAHYYGRSVSPMGFSRDEYQGLFIDGSWCSERNRLNIPGAFYTKKHSNIIAVPVKDYEHQPTRVSIVYKQPTCILERIKLWHIKHKPGVAIDLTRVMRVTSVFGDYLLIGKSKEADDYIERIDFAN